MKLFVIKFLGFYLACLASSSLQHFGLSAVLATALVGFLGSFWQFSLGVEKKGIHSVIYAGAIAGMCSHKYLNTHEHIVIISLIGSGCFLLLRSRLNGFGGKLGVVAFTASVLLMMVNYIW